MGNINFEPKMSDSKDIDSNYWRRYFSCNSRRGAKMPPHFDKRRIKIHILQVHENDITLIVTTFELIQTFKKKKKDIYTHV